MCATCTHTGLWPWECWEKCGSGWGQTEELLFIGVRGLHFWKVSELVHDFKQEKVPNLINWVFFPFIQERILQLHTLKIYIQMFCSPGLFFPSLLRYNLQIKTVHTYCIQHNA